MESKELFDTFDKGVLLLPASTVEFKDLPWKPHPSFEGVALKQVLPDTMTGGAASYHLVKIAPEKCIGSHTHPGQIETHEVVSGGGYCINGGVKLDYRPGAVTLFGESIPHEVHAGSQGLLLLAKFIPAAP